MRFRSTRSRLILALTASTLAAMLTTTTPAAAAPAGQHATRLSGTTAVTTAPGIAATLLRAGVLPLPVPPTGFAVGYRHGLTVTYGIRITGGNPDLAGPSGDILHSGGIYFTSLRKHLEIGRFDIDLAAGKIYATEINFAPGRIAVLDLDLSKLNVGSHNGATVLSGIGLRLDAAAAGALNATFGLALPTDGSLTFGTAVVTLRT